MYDIKQIIKIQNLSKNKLSKCIGSKLMVMYQHKANSHKDVYMAKLFLTS